MNYSLTFELLLYVNVFYFGLYSCLEFALIVYKAFNLPAYQFSSKNLINDLILLTFLVIFETIRLILGQKHEATDFDKDLNAVFRLLVLTVPNMYLVAFFSFWQTYVTRLELALGVIMLIFQGSQMVASFFVLGQKYWPRKSNKS
ncbi:hypothetical protein TCAL_07123 [Tigriopus californicus]|uniref:Intimal thickness related receptor IRP domain-containing protein n=1 Tax=Tigriopus californicus TaxID=6832 RepID=A0A553PD04_TIGCA|nr:uncharacterized protein LOC131877189 [Tigriopus californicus]TRY75540.1 hypothetical protein TCAL_07123 [Tigriopus californicus]